MSEPGDDPEERSPGLPGERRPWLVACLVAVFVAAGLVTVLASGQNHDGEAKLVCERFVRGREAGADVRFSREKVRDLSSVRHVVTGTALVAGRPPAPYTCTVAHGGTSWNLISLTGV
ncbi:hypothetical protein [Actinoallomurus iriomotensis]|uniref:Uncharacterized protein n=1 Tax=Actinoallomurus iriomotensis TaxID=478107 RepID=A0A9W6RR25_9ACTN|nr:hypothetical protein [Actinoallomurus iriomotensis]GLY79980.1 hypothetical protein Airi01_082470 [Actinoallomurus iriomotensis]